MFISTITRIVLMFKSLRMLDLNFIKVIKIYLIGAFYDFVSLSYALIPLILYLLFLPKQIWQSKVHRFFMYIFLYLTVFSITFYAFSEWFFWDEFGVRFNFIAVDYLVYTTEVIGNIRESYPMGMLLSIISVISIVFFSIFYKYLSFEDEEDLKNRFFKSAFYLILPILFFFTTTQDCAKISENPYNNELSKSGLYSLFNAFRNSELDYDMFYITQNKEKVLTNLRKTLEIKDVKDKGILHQVINDKKEKHYNIMMIVVESLSGEFLESLNGFLGMTPNLDALAKESLFFTNFYATGTRTVRGMEAITLSIPPTAGRSVVKRLDNHNMFSSGFIFKSKGYDTKFIYGGHGYFDNMNDFFSHNGFSIVDRTDFSDDEDTFHTIWGVCDEDLFNKTLKESDKSFKANKPFMNFIMTTSNHRPYDYPDNRIDIPSHTGRVGAVKYTDYAIANFIKNAKKKTWFKDTIFVIVADHCAASAGKTDLPINKYHIPLFIYAPNIIKPKKISKIASQIDIMPTIFSLLGWSYESKFYGKDILSKDFKPRALVGTYQLLGLYKDDMLTILSPIKKIKSYKVTNTKIFYDSIYKTIITPKEREDEIISYYQGADILHKERLDRK
jgi:phosphoglycerol transferase MdoB-like AlkP superfamily enzyme